jgi:hypothetical protein
LVPPSKIRFGWTFALASFSHQRGDGELKNAPIPGTGDEREVRGTTPFRLTKQPIKKPAGAATG